MGRIRPIRPQTMHEKKSPIMESGSFLSSIIRKFKIKELQIHFTR